MAGAPEPRGAPKRKSRVILYHSGFAGRFERFLFASPAGASITLLLICTRRKRFKTPVVPVSGSGPLEILHGLDLGHGSQPLASSWQPCIYGSLDPAPLDSNVEVSLSYQRWLTYGMSTAQPAFPARL